MWAFLLISSSAIHAGRYLGNLRTSFVDVFRMRLCAYAFPIRFCCRARRARVALRHERRNEPSRPPQRPPRNREEGSTKRGGSKQELPWSRIQREREDGDEQVSQMNPVRGEIEAEDEPENVFIGKNHI